MGHYLANFVVYTMAMTGLICFAVFVYKKVVGGTICSNSSNILKVEETLNLNPRKTLMIVSAGKERFLVASDVDKTSLISKLGATDTDIQSVMPTQMYARHQEIPQQILEQQRAIQKQLPVNHSNVTVQNELPQNEMVAAIGQDVVFTEEQKSHLDEIYPKKNVRQNARQQRRVQPAKENTVVLDFSKPRNHGLTAIREMAKKINEL